jgi:hypothetical protein
MNTPLEVKNPKAPSARPIIARRFIGGLNKFDLTLALVMNLGARAVLKPPHSRRWRDCRGALDFAKRLECGVFTAAFGLQAAPRRCRGSMREVLSSKRGGMVRRLPVRISGFGLLSDFNIRISDFLS